MNTTELRHELIVVLHKVSPKKYSYEQLAAIFEMDVEVINKIIQTHRKTYSVDDFYESVRQ